MKYLMTALLTLGLVLPVAGQAEERSTQQIERAEQLLQLQAELAELAANIEETQAQLAQTRAALRAQEMQLQDQLALMQEKQRLATERLRLAQEQAQGQPADPRITAARALWAAQGAQEPKWIIGIAVSEPSGEQAGVMVDSFLDDSPAAKAGMKEGDRITAVNGIPVATLQDLTALLQVARDNEITVTVARSGEGDVNVQVTPFTRQPEPATGPTDLRYRLWNPMGGQPMPQMPEMPAWRVLVPPEGQIQQLEERIRALEEALRARDRQPEPQE